MTNYENMFSLKGKTALVAGASRGIGLAIAQAMAASGANTVLAARSADKLEVEAALLREQGYSASAVRLDVIDSASIDTAVGSLAEIDILVNVAGTNIRKQFEKYTREEFDYLIQHNLTGLFELTQRVGERMIARGQGGKIVNIGSLSTILGLPYISIYAITKGGLGQMTRVLAAEWAQYNIQVNCILPGYIETDLTRKVWQDPKLREWLANTQPNPRLGRPEDIAGLAVFLSGAASDYLTAQLIAVDGGLSTTVMWPFKP